jgi:F-type H+-transporting ATPase subunit gamma
MANMRDIRRRIKGVKNTRQITKAMQLVAASKMKKAQDHAKSGRAYSLLLADMIDSLYNNGEAVGGTFFGDRKVKNRGVIVVGTDKGLCGGLNSSLFRYIQEIEGEVKFVSVGKKVKQFLSASQRNLIADFEVTDKVPFNEVRVVVEFMLKAYVEGEIDTVEVVYTQFVNTLVQEPERISILPLGDLTEMRSKLRDRYGDEVGESAKDDREILFEPNASSMTEKIASLFIKQQIYQLILEAKASEHSARMVAMKAATDNASKLVDDLTLQYNRARQAAITQEILEIAAATSSNAE